MATILSGKKSTYGSPYVFYTVSAECTARSATAATIKVTVSAHLQYSSSFLGTGYPITVSIYLGGAWRSMTLKKSSDSWSGTGSHSVSDSWTIPAGVTATAITGISFKANNTGGSSGDLSSTSCSNLSIPSGVSAATTNHSGVVLTGNTESQAKATAKLASIPQNVGYTRVICWYNGSDLIGTTTISAAEHTYSFTGLLPNTTYSLKAEIRISNSSGSVISTKTVSVTTPQETGALTLTSKSTYITAKVSEMFNSPNYTRSIEIYYKKKTESEYIKFGTVSSQETSAAVNITSLISNFEYDVKALIKNGSTTLKTLTGLAVTLKDTSLIPMPDIAGISQQLGTRNITIDWLTDKEVSGTEYKIEAKIEGSSVWSTLETLNAVTSPITVISPEGNMDVSFRITATNDLIVSETSNISDVETFYVRDDFVWDGDKIQGASLEITANEWNRLRDYAIARCEAAGIAASIPIVRAGDMISAETYNIMKNNISIVSLVGVEDKKRGDAITAADIDALRIAVNKVA